MHVPTAYWATQPQADILEHREEQVKGAEGRCGDLTAQLERLRADLGQFQEDARKLKVGGAGALGWYGCTCYLAEDVPCVAGGR
jgi:hypothetical protein